MTCRLRGPGCLSAYFLSPTVHLEPVKAFARLSAADATTMEIWMETKDGKRVLDGTASVGAEERRAFAAHGHLLLPDARSATQVRALLVQARGHATL